MLRVVSVLRCVGLRSAGENLGDDTSVTIFSGNGSSVGKVGVPKSDLLSTVVGQSLLERCDISSIAGALASGVQRSTV